MDECGGLQSVVLPLLAHEVRGQIMQLIVYDGCQAVRSTFTTCFEVMQEARNIVGLGGSQRGRDPE